MGFFDYQVRKHRCLPAGFLFARCHTLRDVQFLEQVRLEVLCPMARSENVMPRDSRVEPLQFRGPEPWLRYCPGRNFSKKLEVIRVHLLKNSNSASGPDEVNAPGSRVVLEVVCAPHAVQHLHHFPRLRVDDNQLPRFTLVPPSNIAGVSYRSATDKQAMMCRVETSGMRHRASGDWPLGDHRAFFEIDYGNMAFTVHNISHSDVQSFP